MRVVYPFSAVIGQEELKLALLLVAIDPGIGGVLISGERGTAKSTLARGLAELLPPGGAGEPAPFVELPLGATEDRVIGSLDIDKVLQDGSTRLRSGLLARADGGVLYVDEGNLLPDHLVDLLLDAAASGWITVERDGLSAGEPARFVLIGTMNPEEGQLRPQFLDRFGLSVQVRGLSDPQQRMSAVAMRLAFDADPAAFVAQHASEQVNLRRRILEARSRLAAVPVTAAHLAKVTAISAEHRLDGIRGDLAIIKAARALAAWSSEGLITAGHIERAAALALPHRSRRRAPAKASLPNGSAPVGDEVNSPDRAAGVPATKAQAMPHSTPSGTLNLLTDLIDRDSVGRRGSTSLAARRAVRAVPFDQTGTLAINDTLGAAAARGATVGESGVALKAADLMQHERRGSGHTSILFLVDASSSMLTQRRLQIARGAAAALLQSSYRRRDEVALMVFRGAATEVLLAFTDRVEQIESAFAAAAAGGRTPLARALLDATRMIRSRDPALVVLFTDGRANVSDGDGDPWQEALAACEALQGACAGIVVIDCELGPIRLGRAALLAEALRAECVSLAALDEMDLTVRIQRRLEAL
jgi:magnesium chelatase subunit D